MEIQCLCGHVSKEFDFMEKKERERERDWTDLLLSNLEPFLYLPVISDMQIF